jgi:hypothetical protein
MLLRQMEYSRRQLSRGQTTQMPFNGRPAIMNHVCHAKRLIGNGDDIVFIVGASRNFHGFTSEENFRSNLPGPDDSRPGRHPLHLPSQPIRVLLGELPGICQGATAWNRDACRPIRTETKNVALRALIADQQQGNAFATHDNGVGLQMLRAAWDARELELHKGIMLVVL